MLAANWAVNTLHRRRNPNLAGQDIPLIVLFFGEGARRRSPKIALTQLTHESRPPLLLVTWVWAYVEGSPRCEA